MSLTNTIEFPEPLGLAETRALITMLARELPATVSFIETYYGQIIADKEGNLTQIPGTSRLQGAICRTNGPLRAYAFSCQPYDGDSSKIGSIQIEPTIDGSSLDDLRTQVLKYFNP